MGIHYVCRPHSMWQFCVGVCVSVCCFPFPFLTWYVVAWMPSAVRSTNWYYGRMWVEDGIVCRSTISIARAQSVGVVPRRWQERTQYLCFDFRVFACVRLCVCGCFALVVVCRGVFSGLLLHNCVCNTCSAAWTENTLKVLYLYLVHLCVCVCLADCSGCRKWKFCTAMNEPKESTIKRWLSGGDG